MTNIAKDNPFTPGGGQVPPLLAGREEEIDLFEDLLAETLSPRKECGRLQSPPLASVVLAAPRGAGRRALMSWLEREACQRGIRVARCGRPKSTDADACLDGAMLAAMADEESGWMGKAARGVLRANLGTADVARIQKAQAEGQAARCLIEELPKKERLLLIVDDLEGYSQSSLDGLLFASQKASRKGYAFALVLAGKTLTELSLLMKSKAEDICYSKFIHINALSDEAAREALRAPFEQAGVAVTPQALRLLAAQAGNYPYFIQLAGAAAWDEMVAADRADLDVELARQSAAKAREGREVLHRSCYGRVEEKGLLPYAHQALEMIERMGGEASIAALGNFLQKHNPEVDHSRSLAINEGLLAAGFVSMKLGILQPGHPFLFDYFKARERKRKPPEDGGLRLHAWLANFLPGPAFANKGG